jgi:hypothetical protein
MNFPTPIATFTNNPEQIQPEEVVSQFQQQSAAPIQTLNVSDADNRNVLLGRSRLKPNARQRALDPTYDAFAPVQYMDQVKVGKAKAERVNKVKQKYGNLTDEQISEILALGALTRSGGFGERVTPSEKNALRDIAIRHQVKIEPDLNSEATAIQYFNRKKAEAQAKKDAKAFQNGITWVLFGKISTVKRKRLIT